MAEQVFQLTASNTNTTALTVTLPVPFDLLTGVELLNTGNYPAATAVPPVTCAIVASAPTAANQVELSGPTTLQFGTGTTLDTTYGTIVVRGLSRGQGQKSA
jgi:hypothetical protein